MLKETCKFLSKYVAVKFYSWIETFWQGWFSISSINWIWLVNWLQHILMHWSFKASTSLGIWTFEDWLIQDPTPSPPMPKLLSNTLLNIEKLLVWSANVVEFSKVMYYFLVLLLGFLLVSINLWSRNEIVFLGHFLMKVVPLPFNFSIKHMYYAGQTWCSQFNCSIPPRQGSNSPIPAWMIGCQRGRGCSSFDWLAHDNLLF